MKVNGVMRAGLVLTIDLLAARRVVMQTAMSLADAYFREFVSPEEKTKK